MGQAPTRSLSIVFVVPFGERREGFFPDTLLAELCARTRREGHQARMVRVYYEGDGAAGDREVGDRFAGYLSEHRADVVVLERLFDAAPLLAHRARHPDARSVLVTRGDSFDPIDGVDWVIGANAGSTRTHKTRRSPTIGELELAWVRALSAIAKGDDPTSVPGVGRLEGDTLIAGEPLERPRDPRGPYDATVEQDVIAVGEAPRVTRKTLFGNVGCPYGTDPLERPHYRDVQLPLAVPMARLGCAFCSMGGDYEKRPDPEVVASLLAQGQFWTSRQPEITELVLSDQHALRYLAALMTAAAGMRPMRWLFAARADAFVRERARIEEAIAAAEASGHVLEVYLSGFEAFSDAELARYNKGTTRADQLAAIEAMRALAGAHPRAFSYAAAKGHSLILWNPWTTPTDLAESVTAIRASGARELFWELGRNRLRLYHDLPITYAAERDGALVEAWQDDDEGAGRRKGYNVELPWRFLDPRTRAAYGLAKRLRARLGAATELAQLGAIIDLVEGGEANAREAIEMQLERLSDRLLASARPTQDPGAPKRIASVRATIIEVRGGCNNGCPTCSNADVWLEGSEPALLGRITEARLREGPLVLAGREPTMHPAFGRALSAARGDDGRFLGLVSNGRRFAQPGFAAAAHRAGLRSASIKLFAADAATADAITRDPGGHAQALDGIRALVAAGVITEVRAPLHRSNLATLSDYAALSRALGAPRIRVEVALDALGLDRLEEATHAIERLASACASLDVSLDAVPLGAGPRGAERIPSD